MNGVEVGVEVNIDLMFALFVSRGSFWLYPSSSAGCFVPSFFLPVQLVSPCLTVLGLRESSSARY